MPRRETLSTKVAADLARQVESGSLQPGEKIPTEAELCEKYDVSRTVIREAVARLRSDGLLIPRQGIGVFVSEAPRAPRFEINEDALRSLRETIELLELRLSVEVESAGLCAMRRTKKDAAKIRRLMETVDAQYSDPEAVSVHYDYDFHLAIAKAARNNHMHQFLSFLAPAIVPRFQLSNLVANEFKDQYYERIHEEHEAIVCAIEAGDDTVARESMRAHLLNSLERFKGLAHSIGLSETTMAQDGDSLLIDQFAKGMLSKGP